MFVNDFYKPIFIKPPPTEKEKGQSGVRAFFALGASSARPRHDNKCCNSQTAARSCGEKRLHGAEGTTRLRDY